MAERLLRYYKYASDEGGLDLKMKLAMATKVPSAEAARVPDSPELVRQFREALARLTGRPAPTL